MGNISKNEKARGAFLSFAIGDALGWPYELNSGRVNKEVHQERTFITWKRKNKDPFWHVETIKKGEYSDDTQLMLAIARSILKTDWKEYFLHIEFPFWLTYERGGGRTVKKAAKLAKKGEMSWNDNSYKKYYFTAGGNGGAMRILPHVVKNLGGDINAIMDDVVEDVIISHGHPRAILGATCYAYALHYLFLKEGVLSFAELVKGIITGRKIWGAKPNGERFSNWLNIAQTESGLDYSSEWNGCYTNMLERLKDILSALEQGLMSEDRIVLENLGAYSKASGAGDVSTLAAVYLFSKYVNTPELAISIPASSIGIDTDTIAAMTGGLIGAFCGNQWIPIEWRNLQDYAYISELADSICDAGISDDKTQVEGNISFASFGEFNKYLKEQSAELINSRYSVLKITKYEIAGGQTIYIKTLTKREDKEKREENKSGNLITIAVSDVEGILSDDQFKYITMRKVAKIIILRSQGVDTQSIAKQTRTSKNLVERIFNIFYERQ